MKDLRSAMLVALVEKKRMFVRREDAPDQFCLLNRQIVAKLSVRGVDIRREFTRSFGDETLIRNLMGYILAREVDRGRLIMNGGKPVKVHGSFATNVVRVPITDGEYFVVDPSR